MGLPRLQFLNVLLWRRCIGGYITLGYSARLFPPQVTFCWQKYTFFSWFWTTKWISQQQEYVTFILLCMWAKYELYSWILLSKLWVLVPTTCATFSQKKLAWEVGTKNHYFESKIQPYLLIFRPQVEENECDILFFLWNSCCCSKSREKGVFLSAKGNSRRK